MIPDSFSKKAALAFTYFTAALLMVLGSIVMFGWFSHSRMLVQIQPSFPPNFFNTALLFFIFGWGLVFYQINRPKISIFASTVVIVFSALTLLQYATQNDLGIDELFMNHFVSNLSSYKGRMHALTAVCFFTSGLALLCLSVSMQKKKCCSISNECGSIVLSFVLINLIGYLFGVENTHGWNEFFRMPLIASVAFLFSGLCILLNAYTREVEFCTINRNKGFVNLIILSTAIVFGLFHSVRLVEIKQLNEYTEVNSEMIQNRAHEHFQDDVDAVHAIATAWNGTDKEAKAKLEEVARRTFNTHKDFKAFAWVDNNGNVRWVYPEEQKAALSGKKYKVSDKPIVFDSTSSEFLISDTVHLSNNLVQGYILGFQYSDSCFGEIFAQYGKDFDIDLTRHQDSIYKNYPEEKNAGSVHATKKVDILEDDFEFTLTPTPALERRLKTGLSTLILLLGGFLVFAVFFVSRAQIKLRKSGTALAKKHSELVESTELARFYQGVLDEGAIISSTDKSGNILYVNDNFCKISGYSREELIGQNHRMVKSGIHPDSFYKVMWDKLRRGEMWQGEICNRAKDGSYYWVFSSIAPNVSPAVKGMAYLSLRFDITAQKNTEAKLVHTAKLATLGEMAGGIAHEINNPLTFIYSKVGQISSSLEAENIDRTKLKEGMIKIGKMAERIANIVKGLKTFSRSAEQDPMQLASLKNLVVDALELCNERVKNHSVTLRVGEIPECQIFCRSTQIFQVLVNLINNADDAISNLTEKWIDVSFSMNNEYVEITVTDSGKGIPEAIANKLMQPFFTTKGVGVGTGLGLSISKGIIEAHKGKLFYDPNCPNTRFVIVLPAKAGTDATEEMEAA